MRLPGGMSIIACAMFSCLAGCGSSTSQDAGVDDLAVPSSIEIEDLARVRPDLSSTDMSCYLHTFSAFFGVEPDERVDDCTCGCIIDSFDSKQLNPLWGQPMAGSVSYVATRTGLYVGAYAVGDGGVGVAGLSSLNTVAPFYLDGDFDLRVEYRLLGTPPADGHAILKVLSPNNSTIYSYSIERQRSLSTTDEYAARLNGIPAVTQATVAMSGTLRLVRAGATMQAWADGVKLAQYISATGERLAIFLTTAATSDGCAANAGSNDGGVCAMTVEWHNLHLDHGRLVDRP